MRTAYTQLAILVLCGATLLDDGTFLVIAASTAVTAILVGGGRRLMEAARGATGGAVARGAEAAAQAGVAQLRIGQTAESADPGFGLAAQD